MTVLPVIERELRLRARHRATYVTRFAVAMMGALLCAQQLIVSGPLSTPAAVGRHVFNEMVGAAFLLACSASLLSAEAISLERREGTLGLLFLTRLKGFDVLLGKLVSVGTIGVCALAALLPALMLPVLAGGVTGSEAFRKGAGLVATLLFSLGAGFCGAAIQPQRFKAAFGAALIILLLVLVPFFLFVGAGGWLLRYAGLASPLVLVITAGDAAFKAAPAFYWSSLVAVQAITWFLLLGAARQLQRSIGRDGGTEIIRPAPSPQKLERELGLARWRPDKAEASPIESLVHRQRGVGAIAWGTAMAALAFSRWVSLASKPVSGTTIPPFWVMAWPLGLAAACVGGGIVAWVAGRFFASVRRTGDLELLLPTPIGTQDLVGDQWKLLKRMFVWPVLLLQLAAVIPVAVTGGPRSLGLSAASPLTSILAAALSFVNTVLGTSALCWLGMWFGLTARRQTGAVLYTVGLTQGPPWLAGLVGLLLSTTAVGSFGYPFIAAGAGVSLLPEAGLLLFYLWLVRRASRGLAAHLAGAEPTRFDLPQALLSAAQPALSALRRLRHWTPS